MKTQNAEHRSGLRDQIQSSRPAGEAAYQGTGICTYKLHLIAAVQSSSVVQTSASVQVHQKRSRLYAIAEMLACAIALRVSTITVTNFNVYVFETAFVQT